MSTNPPDAEIDAVKARLAALGQERETLVLRLRELEQQPTATLATSQVAVMPTAMTQPSVTNSSPAADKVALFRRLFG